MSIFSATSLSFMSVSSPWSVFVNRNSCYWSKLTNRSLWKNENDSLRTIHVVITWIVIIIMAGAFDGRTVEHNGHVKWTIHFFQSFLLFSLTSVVPNGDMSIKIRKKRRCSLHTVHSAPTVHWTVHCTRTHNVHCTVHIKCTKKPLYYSANIYWQKLTEHANFN